MQCRGLVNVVDVEVLFVDLQTEMESKSRVACLERAFRRVLKGFLPEASVEVQGRSC